MLSKPLSWMATVIDIDDDLMKFWRVLRERPKELARALLSAAHTVWPGPVAIVVVD